MLTDSILSSLKPFDKTKNLKRKKRKEAEEWKGLDGPGRLLPSVMATRDSKGWLSSSLTSGPQ